MIQFCAILCLYAIISSSSSKFCSFKYPKDFPDKESVLIRNHSLLTLSIKDSIRLNEGAEIIAACPGSRNSLVKTGTKFALAKCVNGQTLKVGNRKYRLRNLYCSTSVTGEFQATTIICGSGKGVIKHIGYNIKNNFLTLFDICYDDYNGEALYADHVINGSEITYAKSGKTRPSFKVGGLASGVNIDNYKQKSQLKILAYLLGSADLAHRRINRRSYLARGHLAPDADQISVTSSLSTYFYMNTVPQWQQINNGNWKSLEISIRRVASKIREKLRVITGGWEVLQLEDVNENLVGLYLSGDKLPVPKFIWKIAYSLKTQNAIAFISVNNPFLDAVTEDEYICTDICDAYGWGTKNWKVLSKGLLYCCDVDELRKVVDTIPQFDVFDILEGY